MHELQPSSEARQPIVDRASPPRGAPADVESRALSFAQRVLKGHPEWSYEDVAGAMRRHGVLLSQGTYERARRVVLGDRAPPAQHVDARAMTVAERLLAGHPGWSFQVLARHVREQGLQIDRQQYYELRRGAAAKQVPPTPAPAAADAPAASPTPVPARVDAPAPRAPVASPAHATATLPPVAAPPLAVPPAAAPSSSPLAVPPEVAASSPAIAVPPPPVAAPLPPAVPPPATAEPSTGARRPPRAGAVRLVEQMLREQPRLSFAEAANLASARGFSLTRSTFHRARAALGRGSEPEAVPHPAAVRDPVLQAPAELQQLAHAVRALLERRDRYRAALRDILHVVDGALGGGASKRSHGP